jgi:hypothetical protein
MWRCAGGVSGSCDGRRSTAASSRSCRRSATGNDMPLSFPERTG